jgi:hypothetical protein
MKQRIALPISEHDVKVNCGWVYTFHTSKKQGYGFDANKMFVYAMRSLGKGHTTAKRFCALMNMAPPQATAYKACNIALAEVAKAVAVKTMKDAANELGNDQSKEKNRAVSCDAWNMAKTETFFLEWVCDKAVNGEWEMS